MGWWAKAAFQWSGASDKGGRPDNQDYWGARLIGPRAMVVLADGLGGHADGALASRIAVTHALKRRLGQSRLQGRTLAERAVGAASRAVLYERAHRQNDLSTTICVLVAASDSINWAHSGDSRIYRLREGIVTRLTVDHSVAMASIAEQDRLSADVRSLPGRNSLVATLGQLDPLIDFGQEDRMPGDIYALCSDGFWESATEADLFVHANAAIGAGPLVANAVAKQGKDGDNVTLVLLFPTTAVADGAAQ